MRAQHRLGNPGFDGRAAPRGMKNADGDAEFFADALCKEIADGRETADGVGRGGLPAAVRDLRHGQVGADVLHAQVTDERVGGLGLLDIEQLRRTAQAPFHVGLTRGEPHLAHDDVAQRDAGVAACDDEVGAGGVGGQRIEIGAPGAGGVDARALRLAGEGHRDVRARLVVPAPHRHGDITLQHGVIRERRGELERGDRRTENGGQKAEGGTQRTQDGGRKTVGVHGAGASSPGGTYSQ